ncbi:MAG: isochorismatase family protein [Elusimicrobia bacterium]|nr:isochorismatase family protein [Elusimicrobiota bacterium]
MRIVETRTARGLGTLYLADLGTGHRERLIEFVDTREPGVPKSRKWVFMISTQVGCAVGCRMCDAGAAGYGGNLSAAEMLRQVRFVAGRNPALDLRRHPKVKIHFARMGEPSLNPAVLPALRALAREVPNPGLIASVSTVAPRTPVAESWFEELRRVKDDCYPDGRFQLQFSLHSADEGLRREIVPIRKWSLEAVAAYGRRWRRPGDRKVTLNFAPGPGEGLDASAIAKVFDPGHFLIKVTPVNPTETALQGGCVRVWHKTPADLKAEARRLKARGFEVVLSPSTAEELEGETSCGQLWSRRLKAAAAAALRARRREARSYVTVDSMDRKAAAWLREAARELPRGQALVPARAALLVVDMQEFFLDRRSPAYLPPGRAALRNTRRLVEAFRLAGRPVLFTLHAHADPSRDGGLMAAWWDHVCLAGSPWARIAPVLEARDRDVYRKTGYSAFSNPALAKRLRGEGIAQLVLAGVKTDLCVESTARAAFDLGWATFVAADATAARTEERHLAALKSLARGFSGIVSAASLAGSGLSEIIPPTLRTIPHGRNLGRGGIIKKAQTKRAKI